MPSPFPGMDPYIEACGLWEDFHHDLIHDIKHVLAQSAPDRYLVRTGERSYMMFIEEEEKKKRRPFQPDVRISETGRGPRTKSRHGPVVAELEADAVAMRAVLTPDYTETFVEIYEAEPTQRLVTCLEVLSPVNKRPNVPGWEQYQRKRQGLLLGRVHLVELDLLRSGERPPMLDPWPDSPYLLVARAEMSDLCKVWPAHYRRPLPVIPVPLAHPDPDLRLDLQPLIASIYERSRYARSIDYAKPLTPPLPPKDTAWLKRQLKGRGPGRTRRRS